MLLGVLRELSTFQEVDTALASFTNDGCVLIGYMHQLRNAKDKLDLANAQYRSGVADYLAYLNYKLSFLQIQYNWLNQRLTVAQDVIQIYKTLGLGL